DRVRQWRATASTSRSPSRRSRRRFHRVRLQAKRRPTHARRWDRSCRYGRARAWRSYLFHSFPRKGESRAKLHLSVERSGSPPARRRADIVVTTSLMPHHIFPAQERRGRERDQPIGGRTHDRERDDGGDDFGRLAELLAVDQEIAEAFGCAHQFGGDDEHPTEPKS